VAQDAGVTDEEKDLQALLVEWELESAAAAFAELGVERVSHLAYVLDSDIEQLQSITTIAKRISLAMLKWFRDTQKAAEPARKVKREEGGGSGGGAQKKVKREEGAGEAGGGGPSERCVPPLAKGGKGGGSATGEEKNAGNPRDPKEAAGAAGGEAGWLNIRVEYLGDTRNLVNPQRRLCSASTIAVVQSVLQDVTGIAPTTQRLRFAGQELNDVHTLAECGIVDGSVLQLFLWGGGSGGCMQINVRGMGGPGKRVELMVSSSDTIAATKIRLRTKPPGIPTDQQRLLFFGVQMEDQRTLESYGIVRAGMVVVFARLGE
jgi:hypothetical protein